jgi:predicted dehydrogenase
MPEAELAGVHDPDAAMVEQRAAQLGGPPAFTDYREMLARIRPDFVVALGRHCDMAGVAHFLLDEGHPFLIEKPVGLNAEEVRRIADKAATKQAFAAVPLFQRLQPFVAHARRMLAEGAFGPVSHFYFRSNRPTSARYVAWGAPWMLDPALAGGGCLRNVGLHGLDALLFMMGEEAEVTGAQISSRALGAKVEDYATVLLRTTSGVRRRTVA